MRKRHVLALAVGLLGFGVIFGLVGAVVHFERRTRPPGAAPWCLPCPVATQEKP